MSFLKRIRGGGLTAELRLARLLHHHRKAVQAERQGRWAAADVYWSVAYADLSCLSRPDMWAALAASADADETDTAEQGRRIALRLIEEVLIDCHCGFINGRDAEADGPTCERVFVHAGHLTTLLPVSGMAEEHEAALAEAVAEVMISVGRERGIAERATPVCERLLTRHPGCGVLRDRLAEAHFLAAIQSLNGKSDADAAALLDTRIAALERLRDKDDGELNTYDCLCVLHEIRAVKLANAGRLSDALVAGRKAQLFTGGDRSDELMGQLVTAMSELIKQADNALQQVRGGSASLNDNGRALVAQAKIGFGRLEAFDKSEVPAAIVSGRQKAFARRIWRLTGQDKPHEDGQAAALIRVISQTEVPKGDREELLKRLRFAAAGEPGLENVRWDGVARLLLQEPSEGSEPRRSALTDEAAVPRIALPSRRANADAEPFGYALFGRGGWRLQAVGIAAALLLAAATGTVLYDQVQLRARDATYARAEAAMQRGDEAAVIAAAADFLAARPLARRDGRVERIDVMRREAFEAPNRRLRDKAYAGLMRALAENDDALALQHAAAFLEAPPGEAKDPRIAEVKRLYDQRFLFWLPITNGRPGPGAQAVIERYKLLSARYESRED